MKSRAGKDIFINKLYMILPRPKYIQKRKQKICTANLVLSAELVLKQFVQLLCPAANSSKTKFTVHFQQNLEPLQHRLNLPFHLDLYNLMCRLNSS